MPTNNTIDLRTCVPGQVVERRDGTLVTYESKFKCSTDYPHLVEGESYTNDGYYRVSKTEDDWDIVKILPLNKPTTDIDLNTCVPGQKVKLRNESIVEYKGPINGGLYTHQLDDGAYKSNGSYWHDDRKSDLDVVEILPLKNSKPDIDLNTCVPGQKVKLRDGKIGTYDGLINENRIYTHAVDGYSYISNGNFWEDGRASSNDVVEILPMEEEPVKAPPETTQQITDQIDVSNPDHVSIIPQSNGVLISIKKGNTTISWRHYNN